MALSSFTVTVITKSDSPFNIIENAPIEIRERLANGSSGGLSLIFSDSAGTVPITQTGATADSNGQFSFFAAASEYNAVFNNGVTTVTQPIDVGITSSALNSALINDLSQAYTFKTVDLMQASLIVFPVGKKIFWQGYTVESDGGSNWGLVKAGTGINDGGSEFTLAGGQHAAANLKGSKISVLKFGVKADGVTAIDDANDVIIAYAIANGHFTIYAPTGSYYFTRQMDLTGYQGQYTGDGSSSTIFTTDQDTNGFYAQSGYEVFGLRVKQTVNHGSSEIKAFVIEKLTSSSNFKTKILQCRAEGVWYDGIWSNSELDLLEIYRFIFFNAEKRSAIFLDSATNVQTGVPQISHCWLTSKVNTPARYGIAWMGSDMSATDNCLISGFEFPLYYSTSLRKNVNPTIKNIHCEQRTLLSRERWSAAKSVTAGDLIYPTAINATGFMYEAQGSGTTGGTEPDWSTAFPDVPTAGSMSAYTESLVDNGITWLAKFGSIAIADASDSFIDAKGVYVDEYIAMYGGNAGSARFSGLRQIACDIAAIKVGGAAGGVVTFENTSITGEIKTQSIKNTTGFAFACYNSTIINNTVTIGRVGQLPTSNELSSVGTWDEKIQGLRGLQTITKAPSGSGDRFVIPFHSVSGRSYYQMRVAWNNVSNSGNTDNQGYVNLFFFVDGTTVVLASSQDAFSPAGAVTIAVASGEIHIDLPASGSTSMKIYIEYQCGGTPRVDWSGITFI